MSNYTDTLLEQIRDNIDTEVCEERGTRELLFWRHVADSAQGEKVDEIDLIDYTEEVDSANDLRAFTMYRRDAPQVVQVDTSIHNVDTSNHVARNLDHRFYNTAGKYIDCRFDGLSGEELDRDILLARNERLENERLGRWRGSVRGVIPDTEAEKERRERELLRSELALSGVKIEAEDDEQLAHRLASVNKKDHSKKDHSKTVKENRNNTVARQAWAQIAKPVTEETFTAWYITRRAARRAARRAVADARRRAVQVPQRLTGTAVSSVGLFGPSREQHIRQYES